MTALAGGGIANVPERNKRFGVETNGINYIGDEERLMGHRQLSLFWVASSLYPFNLLLGILVYALGLPVWATALVVVGVGFVAYAAIGLASIAGARSGLPTQTLTRVTYGVNPNRINSLLAWVTGIAYEIINVVTGVFAANALFSQLGWDPGGNSATIVAFVLVYSVSVLLPYLGHATVVYVQQAFAVLLAVASVLMLVDLVPAVDLSARVDDTGIGALSAVLIGCGIVISGAWGYVMMASDYPRYMPSRTSARSLFWNVLLSAGGPAAFLGLIGVLLAAQGNLDSLIADPVGGAEGTLSGAIFVIWILAAIGGSVANNALTLYSAGLSAQAVGLPLKRYQATIVDAGLATVAIGYILFWDKGGFLSWLNSVIVFSVVWLGPFGAVWLMDLAWRRWTALPNEVHGGAASPSWGLKGSRPAAWIAMVAGMVTALLSIAVPKYTGPVAKALNGTDLSWLVGPIVAATLYLVLARATVRREVAARDAFAPSTAAVDREAAYETGLDRTLPG